MMQNAPIDENLDISNNLPTQRQGLFTLTDDHQKSNFQGRLELHFGVTIKSAILRAD